MARAEINLQSISHGREGELETLKVVYRMEGGLEAEAVTDGDALRMLGQTGGVVTGKILDAVLFAFYRHNCIHTPFRQGGNSIIMEHLLKKVYATDCNIHDLSNDGLNITIMKQPSRHCTILSITQDAGQLLLPWQVLLDELGRAGSVVQAVLVDAVFNYFQNHPMLEFHKECGRDTAALRPLANNPEIIDLSRNPGRTASGWGYEETIGSEMWLGDGFWAIAGTAARERILGGAGPGTELLPNGLTHLTTAPLCFTSETGRAVMDNLRELVYGDARGMSNDKFAREKERMDCHSSLMQDRMELARQEAERVETLVAERGEGYMVSNAIPPKPPYSPEYPVTGFGYKTAWVAVATGDTAEVARILELRRCRWVPWSAAVERVCGGAGVGITPPVDGWTLVFGMALLDWGTENSPITECSRRFGEVQFFKTYRVCDAHHWSRWHDGKVVRSMTYEEGECRQRGVPEGLDSVIMLPLHPDSDWISVDEEDVMRVAGEWSIDPTTLEHRDIEESHILVGSLE